MNKLQVSLVFVLLAAALLWSAAFTVHQTETAIKLQFGRLVKSDYKPGLHFKVPTPFVDTVFKFDKRILTLENNSPDRALTSEKKNVIVDSFAKWRINDVEVYFKKTGGDERRAETLLSQFIKKGVLDAIGKRTVKEVISGERTVLMKEVKDQAQADANNLGLEVVDLRIKKVEFPPEVNDSVFRRMEKERATVAKQFRSEGEEQSKIIQADADRQRQELLAEAYAKAQEIRGEGDALAAETYAAAYSKNPEFYNLTRSLSAYKNTFSGRNDILILKPDSEFFKYFNNADGDS